MKSNWLKLLKTYPMTTMMFAFICLLTDNENYRLFVTDAHGHVYGIDAGGNVLQTYNILGRQESASVQPVGIAISPHARSFDMDYVFSTLEPFTYEGMAFSDGYVYMMHAESQEKEMIFNLNGKCHGPVS